MTQKEKNKNKFMEESINLNSLQNIICECLEHHEDRKLIYLYEINMNFKNLINIVPIE